LLRFVVQRGWTIP
jgi:drug/metabolite transporter (DMT)-like permease